MKIRPLAALAIAAIGVRFLVKTTGTILPETFTPLPLAQASASLLLTASLVVLLFFAVLRRHLETVQRAKLAGATSVALAGAGIGALVDLRHLLVSVDLATATREAIEAGYLGDAAAVVTLAWFFVALHRQTRRWLRGTGLAIAGSTLLALLAVTLFALQVSGEGLGWLAHWSYLPALLLSVVAALAISGPLRCLALLARDPSPLGA